MNQTNANRITAATLGGAITVLIVWVLELVARIQPPAEVVVALTTLVTFFTAAAYRSFPGFTGGNQSGHAHPAALIVAGLLAALLMGCATQYRPPETVYESLLIADKYGENMTHAVNDLRRAGVITTEQHQKALDHLQDALDTSRAARQAYQAADWRAAETGLDRTEAALHLVSALLVPVLPETPQNEAFIARYGGDR